MNKRPGTIRIIGGQWRRRRLAVPSVEGLRPTPDRVRETLFNWLEPIIVGSRCLDLFAGTGALGLEALSRGAARVVLVDCDPRVVEGLRLAVERLAAPEIEVVQANALDWLQGESSRYDIAFVDPPFGRGLIQGCCERLEERGWLEPGALIYLEAERELRLALPEAWRIEKSSQAGQVRYYLTRRQQP